MIRYDELLGLIQAAADAVNKYTLPRLGLVTGIQDAAQNYRFVVQIPSLGYDTDDKAVKCNVIDSKSYIAPKVDDYVIVQFIDGNRDFPVIVGTANYMKDMITKNYAVGTDVLYSRDDEIKITYDGDKLQIGQTSFQPAARKEDATISSSSEDSTFWTWLVTTLVTTFNAHIHTGVTTGPGSSGPPATPLAAAPTSMTGKINAGSDQVEIGNG